MNKKAIAAVKKTVRFWISWYQPTEDYRPVKWPLPPEIPGFWCSGYGADDAATLCAVVDAPTEASAKRIIQAKRNWPETHRWRFCEGKEPGWMPPPDRFPHGKSRK